MKKIIAFILILLSISGYFLYQKHIQNKNWQYFFENPEKSIFKISSPHDAIFYYTFLQKLSLSLLNEEIVKYSPCIIYNEILEANRKQKAFSQDKLKNELDSQCRNSTLTYNNRTYYHFGYYLCHNKEMCEYILLQLDNFLILKSERIFQISKNKLIELDYSAFFKKNLKIDNYKDIVFVSLNNTGIGNNLFQYYGAWVYAKKNNKKLIVLKKRPIHDIFSNITKPNENFNQFKTINHVFYPHVRTLDFNEKYILLNINPINAKIFIGFEEAIKNQTVFSHPLSEYNQKIANKMQQENAVSIHIRRGDFKSAGFNLLKMSYYENAIQYINEHVDSPHFYIFSDDIKWCKENFKISHPHTFVDWNTKDYEDLHLMTLCKHNIIANSSFSWWGAFLNKHQNKIVVVPKHGFYSQENAEKNEDLISFEGCIPIDE